MSQYGCMLLNLIFLNNQLNEISVQDPLKKNVINKNQFLFILKRIKLII